MKGTVDVSLLKCAGGTDDLDNGMVVKIFNPDEAFAILTITMINRTMLKYHNLPK